MVAMTVIEIPCADIEVVGNIRQSRDAEKVQAIALSARDQGFKAPITVERGESKPYRLIDGWHRLGACELLGQTTIRALILEERLSDADRIEHQLVLNALRTDLTPIEKAQALQRLLDLSDEPKGKVARRIGIEPSAASRSLALLTLSGELQAAIHAGLVAANTAYKISCIKDTARRQAVEQQALAGMLKRDEVPAAEPQRRSVTGTGGRSAKPNRITLALPEDRTHVFTGANLSLDQLVKDLESSLRRARAALKRNLSLVQFADLMNAQAAAGGAI